MDFGFSEETKKGRPANTNNQCKVCRGIFQNATSLASHTYKAKNGKVRCNAPATNQILPPSTDQPQLNLISTNLGPTSRSMFNFPTANKYYSPERKNGPSLESASTAESMLNTLRRSPDWEKAAKLIGSKTFEDIPENMSEDYAMSFLAQAGCYKGTSETFPAALCKTLERLKSNKVSLCLLEQYHDFFINFKPDQDAIA